MELIHKHKKEGPKKFWTTFLAPTKSHGIVSILCLSRHIRNQLIELGFYESSAELNESPSDFALNPMPMGISVFKCLEPAALESLEEYSGSYVGVKVGRTYISSKDYSITLSEYLYYLIYACWVMDAIEGIMPSEVQRLYKDLYECSVYDTEFGETQLCDLTLEDFEGWAQCVRGYVFLVTDDLSGMEIERRFQDPIHMMKYVLDYAIGVHGLLFSSPLEQWFCNWQDLLYSPVKSQKLDILKFSSIDDLTRCLFEMHIEEDGSLGLMSNFEIRGM